MKKLIFNILIGIFLISCLNLVNAEVQTLGIFKQNDCIQLVQTCSNCSSINITSVLAPNSSQINGEVIMTKSGTKYTYDSCNLTKDLGDYIVNGVADVDGELTVWAYDYKITPMGKESSTGESILYTLFSIILFIGIITLSFFIFTMPSNNERDDEGFETKIIRLKYLRVFFIALIYSLIILELNFLNGLAINYVTLTMFSGILGFLFEIMLRGAWPFTVIIFLWIGIMLIHDSNLNKQLNRIQNFKLY